MDNTYTNNIEVTYMFSNNQTSNNEIMFNQIRHNKCFVKVLCMQHTTATDDEIIGYMYIDTTAVISLEEHVGYDYENVHVYREDGETIVVKGKLDDVYEAFRNAEPYMKFSQ